MQAKIVNWRVKTKAYALYFNKIADMRLISVITYRYLIHITHKWGIHENIPSVIFRPIK